MAFTDPFIRRPVLAAVISLLIFIFGLFAVHELPLQEFPQMDNTLITVTTTYSGASASLVQGFVTNPLETSIATADGIDYMTATSTKGSSTIDVYVKLNFDPNVAFTNVMSKVQQVEGQLPSAAEQPVIDKKTGNTFAIQYLSFTDKHLSSEQITDYVTRVVQPQLESASGVAQAQILGGKVFAMRIWLDTKRLSALNLTPADIQNALLANNYQSAAGNTKGQYVAYDLNANTDLENVHAFRNIVVAHQGDSVVRLGEVAKVQLGAQSYDSSVTLNGKPAVFVGIYPTPSANPLSVISNVDKLLPAVKKQLPPGFDMVNVYDQSGYIGSSIREVIETILEAAMIVIIVIFAFLGSFRSVLIPVVTIPLSLVGVCTFLLALGYSLNLLTFLAMVLAIGLVVDDAIVVIENVYRHVEDGLPPFKAAIVGAREIGPAVVSMTITLAAVYAPIGFMGGLTGALFKEFAFTLAGTVILSGIIALTLSPMMCSKFLDSSINDSKIVKFIDRFFDRLKNRYQALVTSSLNYRPVTALFAIVVLTSCVFLYALTKKELAPAEDQGLILVSATTPVYSNFDYMSYFSKELEKQMAKTPEKANYFTINGAMGANSIFAAITLKPWDQRSVKEQQLIPLVQKNVAKVPGLQTVAFGLPPLPGNSGGMPIQFVVTNISGDYLSLWKLSDDILMKALNSGMFAYLDNSLQFNKKEYNIQIDREKAESMGIQMQDIANSLSTAMSGAYINYFSMANRSYEVIPQIKRPLRYNPDDINHIYIKTGSGELVPLSTVVKITSQVQPNSRTEFQQQASATIEGVASPSVTMGTALDFLKKTADETLPKGYSYNYEGQSRQYETEGSALIFIFFFAIVVIYLILAALFESFRDPFIVLIAVPMSICGALIPLNLGLATINIYTQIGLITLIGLISKHGILMVDFANKLQETEGLNKFDAIVKSASIRLRPILMTTFAMVFGVIPLVLSTGAGAASRNNMGLVIFFGMLIGTLFTLFVVPTMYTFFAKKHEKLPDIED
ncbi:MAG: multidrug efflux protein [Gammaproteobacteria bacterium CG11_big_fil_rev_8_21_14_0_20_46_22]|nr:MAG: multidrug efflux protein [Gammaproteobacteria bacterium CG12_big_fil_rev_8_21_14_0_65_46_12]PIR10909.1 MAG: multidrug efflux protein [Gammaproteobacteria bacterium CG11_big_fil_rev_8_21_14_0_20_46_22]